MKKQILSLMVMLSLTYFTANVICAEIYSPKWDKVEIKVQERRTAKTYVITDWPESAAGIGCPAGDREYWDDLVNAWYEGMTGEGEWVRMPDFTICASGHCEFNYEPGRPEVNFLHSELFADQDIVSWGEDHLNLDKADAVMVGWHGLTILNSSDEQIYHGTMSYRLTTRANDCQLGRDEMALGDTDLEFLHFLPVTVWIGNNGRTGGSRLMAPT